MTLTLPDRPFRAYLFDCDGTIVDSMPLHYIAWRAALADWRCTFPEDLFYAWGGRPVAEIVATLNEQHGLAMLVCAGDYQRAKPDPEPFLIAAERLGVAPRDCLVFEDTEMGIQAATAAGMASVKVLQPWERPGYTGRRPG
jgi:beta-phosphoglucomutase-like phosphatase (HAD superfamily)